MLYQIFVKGESRCICGKSICGDETNVEFSMFVSGANLYVWGVNEVRVFRFVVREHAYGTLQMCI